MHVDTVTLRAAVIAKEASDGIEDLSRTSRQSRRHTRTPARLHNAESRKGSAAGSSCADARVLGDETMIQVTCHMPIVVAVEPVAFRNGLDGLARVCKQVLQAGPFAGWLFVFRSRR